MATNETTRRPTLVDLQELAFQIGISLSYARRLASERRIEIVKINGVIRVRQEYIDQLIKENTIEPIEPGKTR